MGILAGLKRRFRERDFAHVGELAPGEQDSEELHPFLDAEKVLAHDLTGTGLARGELVAVVVAERGNATCERFVSIQSFDDTFGIFAECDHEVLERAVSLTCFNLCPFHN